MSKIIPLPNFRSSRIYFPIIVTPVMTSNHVKIYKEDPHIVTDVTGMEPEDPRYNYVEVYASDYTVGDEPYRAFRQSDYGGWLCPIVEGEEQWIALKPGRNWYYPNEYDNFKITKIEVTNRFFDGEICKQFAFQGKDGIFDWETIRICKVGKLDPSYKSTFEIEYPEDHPNGYDEYRLLVQVPTGKENVGFTNINMYYFAADHDEYTFGSVETKGRRFPKFYEKLFVQNDEADGIVWEKIHDNTTRIAITSWYPGFYASTSFYTTIFHPNDTIRADVYIPGEGHVVRDFSNGPFLVQQNKVGGNTLARTRDYVVCMTGSYYYNPTNVYQWTRNGKDWTPGVSVPAAYFQGGRAGFGINDNIGIVVRDGTLYRLELRDDGTMSYDSLGVSGGDIVGDVAINGTYVGDKTLNYYRFANKNGSVYDTRLQYDYEYTDLRESDPAKRVKRASCNWKFGYGNGKYYAAARHIKTIYYNEVEHKWETLYKFIMLRSTDGFATYSVAEELDPCPEYRYYQFGYALKGNNGLQLIERYRELDDNLNITNYYHTIIDGKPHEDATVVPLIGFNSDPAYDGVLVRFSNKVDTGGDSRLRVIDADIDLNFNLATIEKGKVTYNKCYCIPTAFKKNYWSSNSYDEGGFVFFDSDKSGDVAYGTSNYMIDQHNYTYHNITN